MCFHNDAYYFHVFLATELPVPPINEKKSIETKKSSDFRSEKDQQRALVIQLPGSSDHLHESLAATMKSKVSGTSNKGTEPYKANIGGGVSLT